MLILEYNYFRERRKFPSTSVIRDSFRLLTDMTDEGLEISFYKLLFVQKTAGGITHFRKIDEFKTKDDFQKAKEIRMDLAFSQKPTEDLDWAFEAPNSYNYFKVRTSLGMNVKESMLIDQKIDKLLDCLDFASKKFGLKSGPSLKAWRPINNLWADDIGNDLVETTYEGVFLNTSPTDYAKLKHGQFFAEESGSWSMKYLLE